MADQIFDPAKETQKIFDVENQYAEAGTKQERRESASAFDKLRNELCGLSRDQLSKTLDIVTHRSDDAWFSTDKDGNITSLNFQATDYGFTGMDLQCSENK